MRREPGAVQCSVCGQGIRVVADLVLAANAVMHRRCVAARFPGQTPGAPRRSGAKAAGRRAQPKRRALLSSRARRKA